MAPGGGAERAAGAAGSKPVAERAIEWAIWAPLIMRAGRKSGGQTLSLSLSLSLARCDSSAAEQTESARTCLALMDGRSQLAGQRAYRPAERAGNRRRFSRAPSGPKLHDNLPDKPASQRASERRHNRRPARSILLVHVNVLMHKHEHRVEVEVEARVEGGVLVSLAAKVSARVQVN